MIGRMKNKISLTLMQRTLLAKACGIDIKRKNKMRHKKQKSAYSAFSFFVSFPIYSGI